MGEIRLARISKDTPTIKEKKCTGKCGLVKPLTDFHRNGQHSDGRASDCKVCSRERSNARYEKKQAENALYGF